eukprot:CAMPEP_0118957922 /NCGR_PEP_ID=MMETSP1169-20130426/62357_1 /TAXON_ID=36882 /ORGANISM="Pyramimonas obovata, Strain CCMP722" /LENGTH=133 /DNA_ID=CAMNT_0006906025 /DNA_START=494 /DNA_END=895 /DNA_ORIENTATION=-
MTSTNISALAPASVGLLPATRSRRSRSLPHVAQTGPRELRHRTLRLQTRSSAESKGDLLSPKEAKVEAEKQEIKLKSESFKEWSERAETTNGRWAIVGLLAALIMEKLTGLGPFHQVILYLKLVGALGPNSGF